MNTMKSYSEESIADAATAFKTCDGCHRWLRLGMFFDNTRAWHEQRMMNDVCRCCKYQAWLAETAGGGPRSPIASWWRARRPSSRDECITRF
ncbi:hypothetical protein GGR55DRAFT_652622 [Xylaria sp. FL0064]|nr:hypothetical protein GGR55DRAFT_652622 [Xylaria sp. FL0064]